MPAAAKLLFLWFIMLSYTWVGQRWGQTPPPPIFFNLFYICYYYITLFWVSKAAGTGFSSSFTFFPKKNYTFFILNIPLLPKVDYSFTSCSCSKWLELETWAWIILKFEEMWIYIWLHSPFLQILCFLSFLHICSSHLLGSGLRCARQQQHHPRAGLSCAGHGTNI